jgi:hypothetical protein
MAGYFEAVPLTVRLRPSPDHHADRLTLLRPDRKLSGLADNGLAEKVQRRIGLGLPGAQCPLKGCSRFGADLPANGPPAPPMRRWPSLAQSFDLAASPAAAVAAMPVNPLIANLEH